MYDNGPTELENVVKKSFLRREWGQIWEIIDWGPGWTSEVYNEWTRSWPQKKMQRTRILAPPTQEMRCALSYVNPTLLVSVIRKLWSCEYWVTEPGTLAFGLRFILPTGSQVCYATALWVYYPPAAKNKWLRFGYLVIFVTPSFWSKLKSSFLP